MNAPEAFIIKEFYPSEFVLGLRNDCFNRGLKIEPSWHPLKVECPDYHRLHDNYPKAHVKQKFHAFYHHGYEKDNKSLFESFSEIFEIKNFLADNHYEVYNKPSDKVIARVNVHHYPRGGGYQMEHIDPANDFARIQTLICASHKGQDFKSGGVYARTENNGLKYFLDDSVEPGDLLIISPDIQHGVAPIDEKLPYNSLVFLVLYIYIIF